MRQEHQTVLPHNQQRDWWLPLCLICPCQIDVGLLALPSTSSRRISPRRSTWKSGQLTKTRLLIKCVRGRLAPPPAIHKDKYIGWPDSGQCQHLPGIEFSSAVLVCDHRTSRMKRFTAVNYCLGFLGLLLLQGVVNVEGRSIFNPGRSLLVKLNSWCNAPKTLLIWLLQLCLCTCVPVQETMFSTQKKTLSARARFSHCYWAKVWFPSRKMILWVRDGRTRLI